MKKLAIILIGTVLLQGFAIKDREPVKKKGFTVVIDAGHGGEDRGGKDISGSIFEKDLTFAISEKVKQLSGKSEIHFLFTRNKDEFIELSQRAASTTAGGIDLFVSLHISSGPEKLSGIEIYYPSEGEFAEKSKEYGSILSDNIASSQVDMKLNGVKPANFYLLKNTSCPSLLIELGFLSNEKDKKYLSEDSNRELIAQAIITSISAISKKD